MGMEKGNVVIGQSGGPTNVINQSLIGIVKQLKQHPEIVSALLGLTKAFQWPEKLPDTTIVPRKKRS